MARRVTARAAPAWVGDLPVFERTLANGFKALVLPRGHAPVVVCDLYYPVGSANEPPGKGKPDGRLPCAVSFGVLCLSP